MQWHKMNTEKEIASINERLLIIAELIKGLDVKIELINDKTKILAGVVFNKK